MNTGPSRITRLILVAVLTMAGGCAGLFASVIELVPGWVSTEEVREYPLPHQLPKYPGGVSLRFAMVHDVLHERFARHGEAYYRERNRRAREALARANGKYDDASFALMDDLGDDAEAVRVLRDKLRPQEALGFKDRQLYTTYANLGTFLIHGNMRPAIGGDAAARKRVREGLDFIQKSIAVNPEAHFGREIWQAVTCEYLLAAMDGPQILTRYDMAGNGLDAEMDPSRRRSLTNGEEYGKFGGNREVAKYLDPDSPGFPCEVTHAMALRLREEYITRVGAEAGWKEAIHTSHREPVPFDEPTLGIVGMWRLGGGANPHFALALGEIMLRVGQRPIAWAAYERAARMADRFWPDAGLQRTLLDHCRRRQAVIEKGLPPEERDRLRPRFEAELAYGQRYQEEYQVYEAERIRDGASIDDPHFDDDFLARHEPIASAPGDADKYRAAHPIGSFPWPPVVLFAGLFAFTGACCLRLWALRRRSGVAAPTAAEPGR
jgi:hypothetical protein